MERTAGFPLLLAWVAFCTAVGVAVATGLTVDDSFGVRVGMAFGGLVVAVAFALTVAALVSPRRSAPAQVAEAPSAEPAPTIVGAAAPRPESLRADARTQLESGQALLAAGSDGGEWISATQRLLADGAPGAARYFAALGARSFPDERTRLEAHVARLETVVRDFL